MKEQESSKVFVFCTKTVGALIKKHHKTHKKFAPLAYAAIKKGNNKLTDNSASFWLSSTINNWVKREKLSVEELQLFTEKIGKGISDTQIGKWVDTGDSSQVEKVGKGSSQRFQLINRDDCYRSNKYTKEESQPIAPRIAHTGVSNEVFSEEALKNRYELLTEGDVVCVVSSDGFLEESPSEFQDFVQLQVERGISFWYFVPYQAVERQRSLANFLREASTWIGSGNVASYAVTENLVDVFGFKSRYVVFLTRDTKERLTHRETFLYMELGGHTIEGQEYGVSPSQKVWIRLHIMHGDEYYKLLKNCSDPVRDCFVWENHIRSPIQNWYRRNAFATPPQARAYESIRKLINTEGELERAVDLYIRAWWNDFQRKCQGRKVISILDIGSGDGDALKAFLHRLQKDIVKDSKIGFHVVSIEPHYGAGQPDAWWTNDRSITRDEDIFENFSEKLETFNIVLAVHSFYLIDLSYLKKAYMLLKPNGVFVLVTSPLEDNFVNLLCKVIDEHWVKSGRAHTYSALGVKSTDDPIRNYGEDIESYLKEVFEVEEGEKVEYSELIDGALFNEKGNKRKLIESLIAVFGHAELAQDSKAVEEIYVEWLRRAKSFKWDTGHKAKNWLYVLSKSDLRQRLRRGAFN